MAKQAKIKFEEIVKWNFVSLTEEDLNQIPSYLELKKCLPPKPPRHWLHCLYLILFILIAMALLPIFVFVLVQNGYLPENKVLQSIHKEMARRFVEDFLKFDFNKEYCLLESLEGVEDMFRPPIDCSICQNVTEVERLSEISLSEFEEKYAYSSKPVIITDAMREWTAQEKFSFEYFKQVYHNDSPALDSSSSECQFFPYQTSFDSLRDVFSMNSDRAHLRDGSKPWYIGWSNCDSMAANTLRQHYKRPYFLPSEYESSRTDWIFMGAPGYGAPMHIDNVEFPSWQAQVKGIKRWYLEPPPECYLQCHFLEVVVHPGEIIVLDTNRWFHQTFIEGTELSITIGSEYD